MKKSGIIFLFIAFITFILSFFSFYYFQQSLHETIPAILAEATLIFLSAYIVERSLLLDVKNSITRYFKNEFDILKYSSEYSVQLLPPRRSTTKNPDVAYRAICEAISRSQTIKLFCTSGLDIFSQNTAHASPLLKAVREKINASKNKFTINVLSAEPLGSYSQNRGFLENPKYPNYLSDDVNMMHRALHQLSQISSSKVACNCYTYDFTPQAWFILTETEGFVETYHFGLSRRDPTDENSPIGGRVPLLHLTSGSDLWRALNEFFDFLVNENVDKELEKIRKDYFKIKKVFGSSAESVGSGSDD